MGTVAVGVVLAGCGGGSTSDATPTPSASPSVTASPTASPSSPTAAPTRSKTIKPLSAFEGRPQVKVIRKWVAAVAKDVNANDKKFSASSAFVAPSARALFIGVVSPDLDKFYPGPTPFTPVSVTSAKGTSHVFACVMTFGWGLSEKAHRKVEKKKIEPLDFTLSMRNHRWTLSGLVQSPETDCDGVKVKEVRH
ncbi:MAG: hypothetical protein QM638_10360 [Nocardioides sp.]|uniref:hypothetical protein n=1 Tax=Nocardioides sp. TaxID=35761 RepID=UPI0039E5B215